MTSLDDLLTVQDLDTRVDQLRHRRETLGERQELLDATAELARVQSAERERAAALHALRSAQKEAEDHASLLEDKAAEVERSMYDGSVTSPKELESLQAEHRMLKAHQSEHEDRAIELMEQAEPVEEELAEHASTIESLEAAVGSVEQRIIVAEAEIDAEVAQVGVERETAATGVPTEVMDAYSTLRRQLGGIGAARLSGARCEGCHLEIPSAQLEELRHAAPDALITCPECFRILVR